MTLTVETRHAIDPATARGFDTDALRKHFHVGGIFVPGEIRLIYTHYDRMIVGGAVPDGAALTLDRVAEAGTASLLDRRELVVVNIGGDGTVAAAGATHAMVKGDMLYLGMGSGPVTFAGAGRFYILSAPAHATHPTRLIRIAEAATVTLGSAETSNARTIYQFVHPDVMTACQLVVGMTKLEPGFCLEHHAGACARPADGGLPLHRPQRERPRHPPDGRADRDAASGAEERGGGDLATLVGPRRRGHLGLRLYLGDGR